MSGSIIRSCWKNKKVDWSKSFFQLKSLNKRYVGGLNPKTNSRKASFALNISMDE